MFLCLAPYGTIVVCRQQERQQSGLATTVVPCTRMVFISASTCTRSPTRCLLWAMPARGWIAFLRVVQRATFSRQQPPQLMENFYTIACFTPVLCALRSDRCLFSPITSDDPKIVSVLTNCGGFYFGPNPAEKLNLVLVLIDPLYRRLF